MPFCTQCGAKLPDNARFCQACGKKAPLQKEIASSHVTTLTSDSNETETRAMHTRGIEANATDANESESSIISLNEDKLTAAGSNEAEPSTTDSDESRSSVSVSSAVYRSAADSQTNKTGQCDKPEDPSPKAQNQENQPSKPVNKIAVAISIVVVALVAVAIILFASSADKNAANSEPQTNSNSVEQNAASQEAQENTAALASVCADLVAQYGTPEISTDQSGESFVTGVSLARTIDFDGDGNDELLACYGATEQNVSGTIVSVWSAAEGEASCVYEGTPSLHGTNGYFPYVELRKLADGQGWGLLYHYCTGSSPVQFSDELYIYQEGQFVRVAARSNRSISGSSTEYFNDVQNSGASISQDEYDSLFDEFLNPSGETQHFHLYQSDSASGVCDCYNPIDLDETVAGSQDCIDELEEIQAAS